MVAFPTHEVDWSGAGGLFPLDWIDSQSLGLHVTSEVFVGMVRSNTVYSFSIL